MTSSFTHYRLFFPNLFTYLHFSFRALFLTSVRINRMYGLTGLMKLYCKYVRAVLVLLDRVRVVYFLSNLGGE